LGEWWRNDVNVVHSRVPANILNLPEYHVLKVEETEHDYHVTAEPVAATSACAHCHSGSLRSWGAREQLFKDLPMHGKRVGIYIDTRRYRCQSCGKTFFATLPAVADNRQMTDRLVKWIGRQAVKRTFRSLAEETGVVEGTIRNIFRDYINELERTIRFETPKWMGIDEIHLIKPRGVIANIANNTIVELLPNRNKETLVRYLHHLQGKERIQHVAMDMWAPYRDACMAVIPDANIVIDKFHVVRMANDALERVRKSLREKLAPKQRRGLMHDRFVLLKRERDLDDTERLLLSGWVKNYPELGVAHRLKEDFYGIYNAESPDEAQARYIAWQRNVPAALLDSFADLVRAWDNWHPWILTYFDHPITNAYTESLNNLIRVMNRLGRGYSFDALRAKILFAEGAFKHVNIRPKFERKARQPAPVVAQFLAEYGGDRTPTTPRAPSTRVVEGPKNYGVDIATLVRMIEAGAL
jgi:transposase